MEPVAVIAATAAGAREATRRLSFASVLRAALTPCTPASYLLRQTAPSRIVLCAPSGGSGNAADFFAFCAARLLWPAPHADMHQAIDGIRPGIAAPRRVRASAARGGDHRASARLLEGRVGSERAAAALGAGPPLDWIVESARHVRLSRSELAALASRGVRWSALEPLELLGVYGPASLAASRTSWARALPRGVPFWTTDTRGQKASSPAGGG